MTVAKRKPALDRADPKICSICHHFYDEYGNSAQPVNDGRCCNACNDFHVIPARLRQMREVQQT